MLEFCSRGRHPVQIVHCAITWDPHPGSLENSLFLIKHGGSYKLFIWSDQLREHSHVSCISNILRPSHIPMSLFSNCFFIVLPKMKKLVVSDSLFFNQCLYHHLVIFLKHLCMYSWCSLTFWVIFSFCAQFLMIWALVPLHYSWPVLAGFPPQVFLGHAGCLFPWLLALPASPLTKGFLSAAVLTSVTLAPVWAQFLGYCI